MSSGICLILNIMQKLPNELNDFLSYVVGVGVYLLDLPFLELRPDSYFQNCLGTTEIDTCYSNYVLSIFICVVYE